MSAHQFRDYDTLIATIEDWLGRDDQTDAVKGFVWISECDIQRDVRFDLSEKTATGATVPDQEWVELPEDYAEAGLLRWTSDSTLPTISVASLDVMDSVQNGAESYSDPVLRVGSVWGGRLYIGPTPGSAVSYELFYKAGIQHLGTNAPTNRLLREYPDCLLWGSLVCASLFFRDMDRYRDVSPLYDRSINRARQAEERARTGHGALRMRPSMPIY